MGVNFTPGPWRVECGDDENDWSGFWPEIHAECGYCVVGKEGLYGDRNTDLQNAKLIAAAPELLAALEDYIKVHEFLGHADRPHYQAAKAAVLKARGLDSLA